MRNFYLLILYVISLTSCTVKTKDINFSHPRDYDLNYEAFFLRTIDNQPFHNWWLSPKDSTAEITIVFFHEHTRNKSYYLNESRKLVEEGYNVLTFDYSQEGSNLLLNSNQTKEGLSALNYLIDARSLTEKNLILYAQGTAVKTAIDTSKEFGLKPICMILENPASLTILPHISDWSSYLTSVNTFRSTEYNFNNNLHNTPILLYCTQNNESWFNSLSSVSDLTVRAALSGNGSQKILHSKKFRNEMKEFINMSMNSGKPIQPENPQE